MTKSADFRTLDVTELSWVNGGQYQTPTVNNLSTTSSSKVNAAIQIINNNFNSMTQQGQSAVEQIQHIEIDPASMGRSYVDYNTDTLHLNENDVAIATPDFLAGDIMHDGDHILQNQDGGYQGIQSEKDATQLELDNASALGLTQTNITSLQNFMNNDALIQARMDEPVNVSGDTPAETFPDPFDPYGTDDEGGDTDGGFVDSNDLSENQLYS